jgi:hypothetical protein
LTDVLPAGKTSVKTIVVVFKDITVRSSSFCFPEIIFAE